MYRGLNLANTSVFGGVCISMKIRGVAVKFMVLQPQTLNTTWTLQLKWLRWRTVEGWNIGWDGDWFYNGDI